MNICAKSLCNTLKYISLPNVRLLSSRNILNLSKRGIIEEIFPQSEASLSKIFQSGPQCVYAGFDPTADSLHVGNLLILTALLHWQRGGHDVIALIGGATGRIGDPSGKSKDRPHLDKDLVNNNLEGIRNNIEKIFENHAKYLYKDKIELRPLRILNNEEWYRKIDSVEFVSTIGRHFRMGTMLLKQSVQNRINSDVGMSFTEFTYQIFQAYDWLYLYNKYNCHFQIGGSDQMGNIWSGHDLISRILNKQAYGMTIPLVTNRDGNKLGKSEGNAIWLNEDKSSPFKLYQYFYRTEDADVERLLNLFTFLPLKEIGQIMEKQRSSPEKRIAQEKLAQQVTLLVHGEAGLARAKRTTEILYNKSLESLLELTETEVREVFEEANNVSLVMEPGTTVLDLAMKAKCFNREVDAIRIINAGGFFINHQKISNVHEVLSEAAHILPNKLTLIRVGKKNYHIVKWI